MARQLQESAVFAKLGVTEQNSVLKTSPSFFPRCDAAVVEKKGRWSWSVQHVRRTLFCHPTFSHAGFFNILNVLSWPVPWCGLYLVIFFFTKLHVKVYLVSLVPIIKVNQKVVHFLWLDTQKFQFKQNVLRTFSTSEEHSLYHDCFSHLSVYKKPRKFSWCTDSTVTASAECITVFCKLTNVKNNYAETRHVVRFSNVKGLSVSISVLFNSKWAHQPSRPPPLCVEMCFTWTFPRNQDAKMKLKCELISIKF